MQNSEKVNNREEKERSDSRFFKKIVERLKSKDEIQVKERLKRTAFFALVAAIGYLIGGVELFFGTFPIFIALAVTDRDKLFGICSGLFILALSKDVPIIYVFVFISILLVRILIYLLPKVFEKDEESRELIRYQDKKPILKRAKSNSVMRILNLLRTKEEQVAKSERIAANGDGGVISGGSDSGESDSGDSVAAELQISNVFCEEWHVKLLLAAVGGLLCGMFFLFENDFSFYSLCATFVLTFVSPIAAVILGGFFDRQDNKREWYKLLSVGAIIVLCIYASTDKSFLGMPMAPFLSMLLTLCVCLSGGLWKGAFTAILCGLVFDLIYLPLLLLSAILFCLVSALKRNGGLVAVCAVIVVWCYYIGGESGLVGVLPPMLLAIPFYMIFDKYREMMLSPVKALEFAGGLYFAEAVTEKTKNEAVKERMSALSEAFSSLSEVFYKLSDRFRRPDMLGIKRITENAFEENCRGCINYELCWGADYGEILDALKCVTSSLHKEGTASAECFSEQFKSRCIRIDKIINDVNLAIFKTTEKIIKGERIGLFSANYDDVMAILKDALENDGDEYECDTKSAELIFDYLCGLSLEVGGVVVYGKRCKHIVVKGVSLSEKLSANKISEICKRISQIVGTELTEPVFEVGKDGNLMLLYSRPEVRAVCAHGRLPSKEINDMKEGGEIYVNPFSDKGELCGDMTDAFITDISYFYTLISDGMGSGAEAAFTSGVCAMFIEKMLSAGNRADITLRMLNNVIRSENMGCGSECSATVDLLELDLMSGVASFIKSGAAPTYILRGGTVYKISSRTMPVGIIKDADARITKFDTKIGDVIIMISDGCCPDNEDCAWLVEYLSKKMPIVCDGENAGELCEKLKDEILDEAVRNFPPDKEQDDISVSVTYICK